MSGQMYFAETTCDKVTENTVAFQISSIIPEIAPTNGSHAPWERLTLPVRRKPKGLYVIAQPYMGDYPCRCGRVDQMCRALRQYDHYYHTGDLEKKLLEAMIRPRTTGSPLLVAVTIIDGRLVFKLWEPAGFLDIKVLPDNGLLGDCFDFGIQMSRHAREGVRIACAKMEEGEHHYIVERYSLGYNHREAIYATQDIIYRQLRGNADEAPHFTGYMETLAVH